MTSIKIFTDADIQHFKIDTPGKAYSLGFFWGDGHLKRPNKNTNIYYAGLSIVQEDFNEIKNLFFEWENWSIYSRISKGRRPQGTLNSCNSKFGWFLHTFDYDIKSNTIPIKILNIIPTHLKQFWWRGYSDADGCFYVKQMSKYFVSRFSISSNYNQNWIEVEKLFNSINITKYSIERNTYKPTSHKNSHIKLYNLPNVVKFGDYIYNNYLNIGLKRKYDKYLLAKDRLSQR